MTFFFFVLLLIQIFYAVAKHDIHQFHNLNSSVIFEPLPLPHRLSYHSHVFATIACNDQMEPGITVLHESLLRVGHRQPLVVITSVQVSVQVRARLHTLSSVILFRAETNAVKYCHLQQHPSLHSCSHLKLLLFSMPAVKKIIFLEHDVAVLKPLMPLIDSPPFTAIREPHVGLFQTSVMVIKPDLAVYNHFREKLCEDAAAQSASQISDNQIIRTVVPDEAWTEVSDIYNVPQEHMDTLWYRNVDTSPAIIHYSGLSKPWNWWRLGMAGPLSMDAFRRWCEVAQNTLYACGSPNGYNMDPPSQPNGWSGSNRLTVLLSTYRRPTWKDLARHYASFRVVMKVVLIWHDPDGDPPSSAQLGHKVLVWQPKENSLNNRFFAPGNLTECVYVCDDDMKITEEQLIRGFHIWRGHARRLVGFFPRKWTTTAPYYSTRIEDGYNIVLTKGLYTHRYFLYMYVHLLPKRLKDIVDKWNNCEDILFNMMVTGYSGVAPLQALVEGSILDMGHDGISRRGNHYSIRYKCVKELVDEMGFSHSPMSIGSLSEKPLKNVERE